MANQVIPNHQQNGHSRPNPRDLALGQQLLRDLQPIQTTVQPRRRGNDLRLIDSRTFFSTVYQLTWLIGQVLVDQQPMVIGGPKKSLKTNLLLDLAISLATATPFLGRFRVDQPQRVGVYSGESGQAVLQETARRIAQVKRIRCQELDLNIHWCFALPRLSYAEDLAILQEEIIAHELSVVILDPLYLSLLAGDTDRQASNLYDIGPLLSNVTQACLAAGATPIFVHHTRKQSGTGRAAPDLDDLAFAGVQEFARQWLLVGRREAYVPDSGQHRLWLTLGGSAGHSGAWAVDVDEGRLADDFTGRRWDVQVRNATDVARSEAVAGERQREQRQQDRRTADLDAMRRALRRYLDGETLSVLRESSGLNSRARAVLDELVDAGEVEHVEVEKPAGRAGSRRQAGYRLVPIEREQDRDNLDHGGHANDDP